MITTDYEDYAGHTPLYQTLDVASRMDGTAGMMMMELSRGRYVMDVVNMLLKKNADPSIRPHHIFPQSYTYIFYNETDLRMPSNKHRTALHVASSRGLSEYPS